ncbi:T9SS type A sorting domain-containing protein [Marivirga sp.]|uniref:T9SS type A sorting domain-containing protein n=1 Tax=Marivirga sp. TaxID=2018662 RepID=UPI002D7FFED5|nr:T9SS type A sorting domain-containing protein [Marivirga sp.]HET8860878.1 T9SS type A sorting domain-containing protein [Marivirga sp.]
MKLAYAFFALSFYPIFSFGQIRNNGNLRMHSDSKMGLFGDFVNEGDFTSNLGTLHIVGSKSQALGGSKLIQTNHLTINKTSNSLQLDNVLKITEMLTFVKGVITTDHIDYDTEYVEFLDNASYTGESDTSHIDGVIRKVGNDAFVFPTGDNSFLRTIAISAPVAITDHFTAYYTEANPDGLYSGASLGADVHHISACEYWVLNRTNGNSSVEVTLSWSSNSCGVDNLCDLRVAKWNGTQWISEGNGGTTGSGLSGTVVSGSNCSVPEPISNFSPFTLGSFSSDNPLPIDLTSFTANLCELSVCLNWQTSSEINNDFFTIEKSSDGLIWKAFADIKGAGNSKSLLNYKAIDTSPFSGISYYRLKQTDFNGEFKYSSIEMVNITNATEGKLIIYPNPAKDLITLKGIAGESIQFKIFNVLGQEVTRSISILKNSEGNLQLNISLLLPGTYYLKTKNKYNSFIKY